MSNEITAQISISISKLPLSFKNQPTSFKMNLGGSYGPTPGSVLCATTGTDISLSGVTMGGICLIQNLDATNFVTFGIHDGTIFTPIGELLANDPPAFLRLSRHLLTGWLGTSGGSTLRIYADTAAVNVLVQAFPP
jgi:hypothetical protein